MGCLYFSDMIAVTHAKLRDAILVTAYVCLCLAMSLQNANLCTHKYAYVMLHYEIQMSKNVHEMWIILLYFLLLGQYIW